MKLTSEQKIAKQKLTQYKELREVLVKVFSKKMEMLPIAVTQIIEGKFTVEQSEEMKLVLEQFEEYDLILRSQLGIETLYSGQQFG